MPADGDGATQSVNPASETAKTAAPEPVTKADIESPVSLEQIKTKRLRALFDQFDDNPKDGKLDRAEFKLCMNKIAEGRLLRDDVVEAAFNKIDLNHSGDIDFDEFTKGYDLIERYATDKPAQTATKAMDIAKATSVTVSVALSAAETISKQVNVDVKTSSVEETQPLKSVPAEEGSQTQNTVALLQMALTSLVSISWGLVVCNVFWYFIPMIAFWVAVGSGEACDVPLDTFCWGAAIVCTIGFIATIIQIRRSLAASKSPEGEQEAKAWQLLGQHTQTDLDATQGGYCFMGILWLIWNVIGLYWFVQTGFLAGGDGNCEPNAPTVYVIVWWYWLCVVIGVCSTIPLLLFLVCCLVIFGNPSKISMAGNRS